jgi:formylglycine-generating enzyme required for sulfatase activity
VFNTYAQLETFSVKGVEFDMMFVEGDSFLMGCNPKLQTGCVHDEQPAHSVNLPDFFIGRLEVSQLLWRTVMEENPSKLKGDHLPVNMVSYNDCRRFIRKLNELTGLRFSLPTEAQWEYAARGGNKSKQYAYSGSNNLDEVAWYANNSKGRPQKCGDKVSNELGLQDMSGNVWEWCNDWYGVKYYEVSPKESPQGLAVGTHRVFRGGSWRNTVQFCRLTQRNYNEPNKKYPDLGLRLVLNLSEEEDVD